MGCGGWTLVLLKRFGTGRASMIGPETTTNPKQIRSTWGKMVLRQMVGVIGVLVTRAILSGEGATMCGDGFGAGEAEGVR